MYTRTHALTHTNTDMHAHKQYLPRNITEQQEVHKLGCKVLTDPLFKPPKLPFFHVRPHEHDQ